MNCRSLPFRQLPHQPKLFLEYLDHFEKVKSFYHHPSTMQAVARVARKIDYPDERRSRVAAILRKQNGAFGAGAETNANLDQLTNGAVAAVFGQQGGVFGRPGIPAYKSPVPLS